MNISKMCTRIIAIGFAALFFVVPLLLTPWNYELFEYNKMMAVYALTVIIVGAWVIKMINQREIRITRTPLDIPLALFLSSQLLSSLFSIDPHVSWFGYYSRFNGGMLSIISYVLLFYAFVSNFGNAISDKRQVISQTMHSSDLLPITYHVSLFIKLALASGVVVSLYAVAERLGIDKHLWVQDVQNRVFSTLGQPNWLAAYVITLIPLTMAWGLSSVLSISKNLKQVVSSKQLVASKKPSFFFPLLSTYYLLLTTLFFSVLLFTRSRSGLAGFAVADILFWALLFFPILLQKAKGLNKFPTGKLIKPLKSVSFLFPFVICHLAFGIVIFLNGTHIDRVDRWVTLESWKNRFQKPTTYNLQPTTSPTPSGTLLEYGGTESGTIRKYVWQAAINAWQSSTKATLIGTGTETFAFAFFRYKPVEHNLTSEWDFLYNKAHNEYLNYLATTGIFGLGSYLLLIGSFAVWFIKFSILNSQFSILQSALFAGWTSILVTNFFGFSVVVTNVFLFLFPAIILVATRDKRHETSISRNIYPSYTGLQPEGLSKRLRWVDTETIPIVFGISLSPRLSSLTILLALLALLALLVLLAKHWYADTLFAGGYRYSRAAQFPVAYPLLSRAIHLNNSEPLYHDEYAATLAGLAGEAFESQESTSGAELIKRSLTESDKALTTSPQNVNFWKTRTKIFYAFASLDPQWNTAAIEALEKAADLAPTDPKIFYNLAILYGRQSDNKKAIELLQKTIELKPNYRDASYALWVFYTETKQGALAKKVLQTYLEKVDPGDKDFLERVKQ